MDGFYDNAMDQSTDGIFKAVCLSGIKTEDNDGGSQSVEDASVDQFGYATIILRPLTPFGAMMPDPASYTDPIDINQAILSNGAMFSGRSDFIIDGANMPQFGQIVNCYYEQGSIGASKFTALRFADPKIEEFDERYRDLGSIEGVQTGFTAFEAAGGHGALLGELDEDGLDPRYPPREWLYVGSNQQYYNSILQNGNLPSDLLGKTNIGGKFEPKMLTEIVSDFEALAAAFRVKFPTKTLGGFGYRTYKGQLSVKITKPHLAAKPGTSKHGWGQAVDVHYYEDSDPKKTKSLNFKKDEYKWLAENAPKYNWFNPPWAREGKKKEEAWHWESTRTIFTKR